MGHQARVRWGQNVHQDTNQKDLVATRLREGGVYVSDLTSVASLFSLGILWNVSQPPVVVCLQCASVQIPYTNTNTGRTQLYTATYRDIPPQTTPAIVDMSITAGRASTSSKDAIDDYCKSSRGLPAVSTSTPVSVILDRTRMSERTHAGGQSDRATYRSVSSNCALRLPSIVTDVQSSGQCSRSQWPRLIIYFGVAQVGGRHV